MKTERRKLIGLIIMALSFSAKVSGQTADPKVLLGCHLQPSVISIQSDTLASIGFGQSAVPYTLNLKEPKSKQKLDLLKKAKLEKKPLCIYVSKNSAGGSSIITDVKWVATRK